MLFIAYSIRNISNISIIHLTTYLTQNALLVIFAMARQCFFDKCYHIKPMQNFCSAAAGHHMEPSKICETGVVTAQLTYTISGVELRWEDIVKYCASLIRIVAKSIMSAAQ